MHAPNARAQYAFEHRVLAQPAEMLNKGEAAAAVKFFGMLGLQLQPSAFENAFKLFQQSGQADALFELASLGAQQHGTVEWQLHRVEGQHLSLMSCSLSRRHQAAPTDLQQTAIASCKCLCTRVSSSDGLYIPFFVS